jgi:putative CocE/NonD family hydrolase
MKLPPAVASDLSGVKDVPVLMTDGVVLLADRWYPRDAGALPTVLIRSSYGRRGVFGLLAKLIAERGYHVVIQSCRGTGGSGGEFVPFRDDTADGVATLGWLETQPWFNGAVGTWGPSYLGLTQWALAGAAPDFLKAIAPSVTAADFQGTAIFPGGNFALASLLEWAAGMHLQDRGPLKALATMQWARAVGRFRKAEATLPLADADAAVLGEHVQFFQEWVAHDEPEDPWWDPVRFSTTLGSVRAPATLLAGAYDLFLPGQLADYVALRAAGQRPRLTIGPWAHSSRGMLPAALRDGLDWFAVHLKGADARPETPPVRVYLSGANTWLELADWPPEGRELTLHLHPDGFLSDAPAPVPATSRYEYDPRRPTPGVGGAALSRKHSGPRNQRAREERADVLCFTSASLGTARSVVGPVHCDLYVASSAASADFFVRLCDVSDKGVSTNIVDGIVRIPKGALPESGTLVRIDLWPISHCFAAGHRIRLQVSSGAYPMYSRNLGTGEPLSLSSRLVTATQRVLHGPDHPSALHLPIVDVPNLTESPEA